MRLVLHTDVHSQLLVTQQSPKREGRSRMFLDKTFSGFQCSRAHAAI